MKQNETAITFPAEFMQMKKTPAFSEFIHWQELQNRILILNDEINDFLVEDIIMPIIKWNKEDDEAEASGQPYERKPITLYLNSPGGDVFTGLVIAEVIKKSRTPVHITAISLAASMGSVILMAGHKRSAYQFANVLIHDGDVGIRGTTNKVKDNMIFFERKHEQIKEFVLANSKITSEKYDEMKDREWWLVAESALEYGIIDEIIQ